MTKRKRAVKKAKFEIPKKVKVAGLSWDVTFDSAFCNKNGVLGATSMNNQEIILDPNVSPEMIMSTFLHELIHAINFQYGVTKVLDDKIEEIVTNAISNGLWAAIQDNNLQLNVQ